MRKRNTLLSVVLIVACLLCAMLLLFSFSQIKELRLNNRASSLLTQGRYEEAMELYSQLGDEEMLNECRRLIKERMYLQAERLMDSGEYEEAEKIFASLADYRDAREQILRCRYLSAEELFCEGKCREAFEIFKALGDYSDSRERLDEVELSLYMDATELVKACRFADALEIYELLDDYENSRVLASRCRARVTMAAESGRAIIAEENLFTQFDGGKLYIADCAYVFIPDVINQDTDFMIFFPGGRDIEEPPEYIYNYISASQCGTIALFLYKNGLYDMNTMSDKALTTLQKAADECAVPMGTPLLCGTSMGAYPAMHAAAYYIREYDIPVRRVLCFDAGVDWEDEELVPSESECTLFAEHGTQFWLFEQDDVGPDKSGIAQMVSAACEVTIIACKNGEHNAILYDALDCGMIEYALGRREKPISDNYTYFIY